MVAPLPRPAPGRPLAYDEMMRGLANSFGASFWLKKAAVALDGRDPLDALRDAKALVALAEARCRAVGVPS